MPLNIYPQQGPHEEAVIIGDMESLALLARHLIKACNIRIKGQSIDVMASDGEGYKVIIALRDDTDLLPPYYEHTEKYGSGGKDPIEAVGKDTYKQLMED